MTSHSPASSPELPDLPLQGLSSWLHHMAYKFPADAPTLIAWAKEATAIAAIPLYCRDSHEASLKYVKGYEAGSAAAAQAAWRPIAEAPKDGAELLLWRSDCGQFIGSYTSGDNFPLTQDEIDMMAEEVLFAKDWFTQWPDARRLEGSEIPTRWQYLPAAPTGDQA